METTIIRKRRKLLVLLVFAMATAMWLLSPTERAVKATDLVVEEISNYRNWKKVTKQPITVDFSSVIKSSAKEGFTIDGDAGGG